MRGRCRVVTGSPSGQELGLTTSSPLSSVRMLTTISTPCVWQCSAAGRSGTATSPRADKQAAILTSSFSRWQSAFRRWDRSLSRHLAQVGRPPRRRCPELRLAGAGPRPSRPCRQHRLRVSTAAIDDALWRSRRGLQACDLTRPSVLSFRRAPPDGRLRPLAWHWVDNSPAAARLCRDPCRFRSRYRKSVFASL